LLTPLEGASAVVFATRASIVNDLYVGLVAERSGQATVKLPLLAGHDEELSSHGDAPPASSHRASGSRGGPLPLKTPDGETFEEFVRKALVDELKIAELYAAAAPVVLTGRLDAIDFQSGADATWRIKVTLSASNGKSLSSSYYGETACNQTAHALMPAVQNVVSKVVRHPDFPSLMR
jgi:hypothetical protein